MSAEPEPVEFVQENAPEGKKDHTALRVITWLSVGAAVAAVGFLVGQELRSRYKFNRRTPYDFYANAGEKKQASEFGMGV